MRDRHRFRSAVERGNCPVATSYASGSPQRRHVGFMPKTDSAHCRVRIDSQDSNQMRRWTSAREDGAHFSAVWSTVRPGKQGGIEARSVRGHLDLVEPVVRPTCPE